MRYLKKIWPWEVTFIGSDGRFSPKMCLARPKMTSHESPKTRSGTLARAILGENQPPDPIKMTPDGQKNLKYLIVPITTYILYQK